MKSILTILITLLISIASFAQQGINYKAHITDTNGNALVLTNIPTVQFIIYKGSVLTDNVYQETHTPTTDANGIIVLKIGTGTTTDVFADIDWESDEHWLNVKIDIGSGLTNMGTTEFMAVPYALSAGNVSGLEKISENDGSTDKTGWRLKRSNTDFFGPIGDNAVDFSFSDSSLSIFGAMGENSTAFGYSTIATGERSIAAGSTSVASGLASFALGSGASASGPVSFATGIITAASGFASSAFGYGTIASGYATTAIGRYNIDVPTALFVVGNGTYVNPDAIRSNALVVFEDGTTTVNNISDSDPDLILGGTSNTEENGILSSDPQYSSSDIFIKSNDKVFVHLDNDNNEESAFSIVNGNGTGVFQVLENGTATANNISDSEPDLILGGTSDTEENGIISSDPQYISSDIFIKSNDKVQVYLDTNNDEESNFSILNGSGAGVFQVLENGTTTANNISDSEPDLILGGTSDTEENGIISSDPQYISSDIFIKSNDKVLVYLDTDNNEESTFSVVNGDGTGVFQVSEDGTITASGFDLSEITDDKALITKEYADTNLGSSGLEQITQNGNTGWRLIGRIQSRYEPIGFSAVDLSYSFPTGSERLGAKGNYSIALGRETESFAISSTAMGYRTLAYGDVSIAMGYWTKALGDKSTAMGTRTTAESYVETTIGSYNTSYTPNSTTSWDENDRLFVVGNGAFANSRSDALTVLKNGNAIFDGEIQRPDTGNADMIPIAYGTVESNANELSGTGNFTATISSGVITITVANENLTVFNSACTIVPYGGNPRFSTLTYINNKLEVRVFNSSGALTPTTFQFVLYKL